LRPLAYEEPKPFTLIPACCLHFPEGEISLIEKFVKRVKDDPTARVILLGDSMDQERTHRRKHRKSYVDDGGTLLICSHAMYYISAFCKRALWMREGGIESLGPTQQVVPRYEAYLDAKGERKGEQPEIIEASPSSPARFTDVHLVTGSTYRHASRLELEIAWICEDPEMAFHLAGECGS